MDFHFSEDALMLRDMLQKFVEKEAKPLEMKYFTTGSLEPKERAQLHKIIEQMGIWGLTVPEEFGGGGLDLLTTCLLEEELGKTFIPMELGDVPPLLYECQGEQVERFLEPALRGSRRIFLAVREPGRHHPEEWTTEAEIQGETYRLTGLKILSSQPGPQDFLIVFSHTLAGVTAFLLDANQNGIEFQKNGQVILSLQACEVNPQAILGELGHALSLGADRVPRAWISISARYLGLAGRLIRIAVEYAKSWVSQGVALSDRPAVRRLLAEAHMQMESVRWLVYYAAWLADQGSLPRLRVAEVRLAAGEMIKTVTDLLTMVYGGPAPQQGDVQYAFHNAIPMAVLELGLDSVRAVIAQEILSG